MNNLEMETKFNRLVGNESICPDCGSDLELMITKESKQWYSKINGSWVLSDTEQSNEQFLQCEECGFDEEVKA